MNDLKGAIYTADSFERIKQVPDQSIDVILTDPPYNLGRYSTGNLKMNWRADFNNDIAAWDVPEFHPRDWLTEFQRILKPAGNLFVFTSYNMLGQWHEAFDPAFDTFQFMVWHKTNPAPKLRRAGFLNSCELIICAWNKGHTWNFGKQNEMHNFIQTPICMGRERLKHLKPHGDGLRGQCPCCQEGNDRAFVVTPAKNSFYCFSEKKGGDIIELAARFYRIPQKEAAQRIAKHVGLNGSELPPSQEDTASAHEARSVGGFDAKAYQASLDPAHPVLKDCGIPEQTIRDFNGGYCSRGLNRGRLVLPIHDGGGNVLAFMGMALNGQQPDILFPKGFEPPHFFNLHRVGKGVLYLVQSPRDVLRAWDAQLVDVICPLVPLTPDLLDALAAFMRERKCHTLEVY